MSTFHFYTNKRQEVLSWAKVYISEGYNVKSIERWGQNGRPGHSKFALEIYNPGIPQVDFEKTILGIWNTKIR